MKAYTFPILMAEVIFRISSHSQVSKEETEHFFKINFKKTLDFVQKLCHIIY